ncbi:MAG: hypothetical protein IJO38_02335 [Akkermansia sp.]|nr:hypothetical protein [Akkermansia sp.]
MSQEIKMIPVKELVLWSENPRDPMSGQACNQDIVNAALKDNRQKWMLSKLAASMGDVYDMSELPTVVYKSGKPVVYDGNRRIILAMIHLGVVDCGGANVQAPSVPEQMPCNVCDEETALNNVYRKHSSSGSWDMLERDIFVHYNMKRPKSVFLAIEETLGGFISSNPELNQRFVKEEVLDERTLAELGVRVENGVLQTQHTAEELQAILTDILSCVKQKQISTRKNRGRLKEVVSSDTQNTVEKNKGNPYRPATVRKVPVVSSEPKPKETNRSRRVKSPNMEYFGGKLILRTGDVNNLYRDVESLANFYRLNKSVLSDGFPSLLRMAFRLVCESASLDLGYQKDPIGQYVDKFFDGAKKLLSADEKTFLSNQNVKKESIKQLLHTGAHNYTSTKVPEQGVAVSIIVGKMLLLSHGKSTK